MAREPLFEHPQADSTPSACLGPVRPALLGAGAVALVVVDRSSQRSATRGVQRPPAPRCRPEAVERLGVITRCGAVVRLAAEQVRERQTLGDALRNAGPIEN